MKLKSIYLFVFYFVSNLLAGQALHYRNFEFESKPPQIVVTEEEKKDNKAIILRELKAKELIVTPSDNVENYLFYYRATLLCDIEFADKLNKIYIPVQSSDELLTLKCRITKPNGKTVELLKGDMKTITEDEETYHILALEGLEVGAIIEYFYIKKLNISYYVTEYVNANVLLKEYSSSIISPENLVYFSKSYNGMSEAVDTTHSEKNFKTFSLKNIAPSFKEDYSSGTEKYPRFEARLAYNKKNNNKKLFTYSDYSKQVITNYLSLEKDDEKAVNSVYKKLKLDKFETDDEKVFAIESYIKNELGIMNNTGDLSLYQCLDKKGLSKFYQNKLTTQLLTKCNIPFEIVATVDKRDKPFDPDFESYSNLQDILIYIPSTKKYLTFESLFYRYGDAPSIYCNQKSLFFKPFKIGDAYSATNSIKTIEAGNPANNYDYLNVDISFKLLVNKSFLNVKRIVSGISSGNTKMYYFYYEGEKREALLKEFIDNALENSKASLTKAENYELDNYKLYKEPFKGSGIIEATNLIEKASENYIFNIGKCIGPQGELKQEQPRKYKIYAGLPHNYKRILTFKAPDGFKIEGLEKLNMNVEYKDPQGNLTFFKSVYTEENGEIKVTIEEGYGKEYYDVSEFENFQKVVNAATAFNKINLLFKKI